MITFYAIKKKDESRYVVIDKDAYTAEENTGTLFVTEQEARMAFDRIDFNKDIFKVVRIKAYECGDEA